MNPQCMSPDNHRSKSPTPPSPRPSRTPSFRSSRSRSTSFTRRLSFEFQNATATSSNQGAAGVGASSSPGANTGSGMGTKAKSGNKAMKGTAAKDNVNIVNAKGKGMNGAPPSIYTNGDASAPSSPSSPTSPAASSSVAALRKRTSGVGHSKKASSISSLPSSRVVPVPEEDEDLESLLSEETDNESILSSLWEVLKSSLLLGGGVGPGSSGTPNGTIIANGNATPRGGLRRKKSGKKGRGKNGRKTNKAAPVGSNVMSAAKTEGDKALDWWHKYEMPRKTLHSSIGFLTSYLYVSHVSLPQLVQILSGALVVITSCDIIRFRSEKFEKAYEKALGPLMRESEKTEVNGVIWYLVGVIIVLTLLPRDLSVLSILFLSWVDTTASVIGRMFGKYTSKLPSPPFGAKKSWAGFMGAFVTGAITSWCFWKYLSPVGHENDLSWIGGTGYGDETTLSSSSLLSGVSSIIDSFPNPPPPRTFDLTPTPPSWTFLVPSSFSESHPLPLPLSNPQSTLPLAVLTLIGGLVAAVAEGLDLWGWDDNLTIPILSGVMVWASMRVLG